MFKFGDYTLQELAMVWDCSEEAIFAIKDHWRPLLHVRRQYWLFGPLLFDKQVADEMAPHLRALLQQTGTTRADLEAHKLEMARLQQRNKELGQEIANIRARSLQQQEEFFRRARETLRGEEDL